jgi:histidinol-phosphate/aromatic aminotransferase/cobyric acid decarboxylase-like protein
VLHSRADLESLRSAGRVLVVDEAFMDGVTGEPETLINPGMDNLLVLRSLTKTWGIAGLRAGYVVGDPRLISQLEGQQPHWSVSAPAAAAMVATATPHAGAEADAASITLAQWRHHLVRRLDEHGYRVVPGVAPFVLLEVGEGVRERLRAQGFAVRRGGTFPGLDERWIRVAVREPRVSDDLVEALLRAQGHGAVRSVPATPMTVAAGGPA